MNAAGDWYAYGRDRTTRGPLTEKDLREQIASGELTDDALVWNEAGAGWQPAQRGLAVRNPARAATPPPLPGVMAGTPLTPPPIPPLPPPASRPPAPAPAPARTGLLVGVCLLLLGGFALGLHLAARFSAPSSTASAAPLPAGATTARSLEVPGNYATIQAALDAARPGDTVRVARGTYRESLWLRAGVLLRGEGRDVVTVRGPVATGAPALRVTDLSGASVSGIAFELETGADASRPVVLLEGGRAEFTECTVRGGPGDGIAARGGALVLRRVRITDHHSFGLVIRGGGGTVSDCEITSNGSAGILLAAGATTLVTGCRVEHNQGGIVARDPGTAPTLRDNRCAANGLTGIGFVAGACGLAEENTLDGNRFDGISVVDPGSAPVLRRNRILNNAGRGIGEENGGAAQKVENFLANNALDSVARPGSPTVTAPSTGRPAAAAAIPGVTEADAREFVGLVMRATETGDPNLLAGCYAANVDYQREGVRTRDYVRRDYERFFQRYPRRSYALGPVSVAMNAATGLIGVSFEFDYRHQQKDGTIRSGRGRETWTIRPSQGRLQIVSHQEAVIRNAPAPAAPAAPAPSTDYVGGNANEIEGFARTFYRRMEAKDVDGIVGVLANRLAYQNSQDYGTVPRGFVRNDLVKYFALNSSLSFQVSPAAVTRDANGDLRVSFRLRYRLDGRRGVRSGLAAEEWIIRSEADQWRIVSWRETVRSD